MLNEIDCFFAGVLGGGIATASVFYVFYIHFHQRFKNYFYNKEHFKTRMLVGELKDRVDAHSIQLARLNAEAYYSAIEDEYK